MKKAILGMSAVLSLGIAGGALAGYADDRAEIENLSNRYMIAVDAGDIETGTPAGASWARLTTTRAVAATAWTIGVTRS